jgi:hypothetical protein
MPRPETVDKALEQIGKSAANYRYFFEKLSSPSWLAPLAAKGRFSAPPAKIEVEGGIMFPPWPESQYLARMARIPEAQAQVLQIVLGIPATDNIGVHADLMDVALALPPAQSAQLVDRARTWVQNRFEGLVTYKIGDLIEHLAGGGQAHPALRLASAALALEPAVPVDDEREWAPAPEPRAYLKDWNYEEALKKALPALVAADSDGTFALLCELLDRAVMLSRRSGEAAGQDYSYIWHDAIEQDEYPPRLRNSLISAVRNAAETMIKGDAGALVGVLAELRRHPWPVFKRIELHLLNRFAAVAIGEITPLAVQLAAIDPATSHEAARLLKTAFGQLPPATQEEVLQWIDAGPGDDYLRRALEFVGQQADADVMERYANQWRAQRYALFADQVPAAWKDRVDSVLAAAGETRKLDELEDEGGWVGPTSPKTAADLEAMGPAAVIAFLRTWAAPRGHFVDTPEGLGRVLGEVISRSPVGYVEHAMEFSALDPTFVRFFFSGLETALKEHRPFAWQPVLSLAQWVLAQPREIAGRKMELMEADESWQWTRGAIANLLDDGLNQREAKADEPPTAPIPFDERERIWAIIEPITHDPDPTPDHEAKYGGDNMDPPTLAINSLRGKAMSAMIAYALWVRHYLDRPAKRPPTTFELMPEVQRSLEEHLDLAQEPSLAIRSLYGRFFPWLHLLNPAWAQGAIPSIFPADERSAAYRAAAWDAYLMFCRPYDLLLPLLALEYLRSVQQLASADTKKKRGFSPRERLAEHLMTYFWRDKLALDGELLTAFFQVAPDELRGRAIDFLGRSLAHQPDTLDATLLARLRALWESRVETARHAANAMNFREELSHFGWWFSSRRFTPAWSFEQLHTVLSLVKHIEPEFKVAEALEALAPDHPLECVRAVHLMAVGDRKGWEIYANEKHFQQILATAIASGNLAAKAAADDLIQYFVTRGQFSYRSLLG